MNAPTPPSVPTRWALGLAGALAGSTLASVICAWADARYAAAAGATMPLFRVCLGLIVPLAGIIGGVAALLRTVFFAGAAVPLKDAWRALAEQRGPARASWAVLPPLVALGALLGLVMVSRVAAQLLAVEASGAAAFALFPLAVLPLAFGLVAATRWSGASLAEHPRAVALDPRWSVSGALVLGVLGLWLLVVGGETSGAGSAWQILGVLRRPELDLRAPGLLLVALGLGLLLPSPRRFSGAAGLVLLSLAPLGLTLGLAKGNGFDEATALAVERHAPLSRIALALLRKATDRDHDGVSALFAGGDCDDHDPKVSPRAVDIPGNGRDEDCQGGDAKPPKPRAPADVAAEKSALEGLPSDLNVLFVTIDTLRADLGYAGNPRNVSPNLDALAKQSVVFEHAYSLASYTGKSMGPLMIGKYSSEVEGGFSHFNKYSKREVFIGERLKAAGIHTLSVQGYWYFYKDAGFERGFDLIDSSAAPKVASIEGDQTSNSDEQADATIKLLQSPELAQGRFFMWMHFVDPHAEYAAHPEHDFGTKQRDRYDGEVAFVDEHLGRVLAALDRSPLAGRTAVVVTSDHGEAFNEHGMIRHGFELWEELVHVPLIFKVPGVAPRRVAARRSAIDVVPTLLDLFKVPFSPMRDGDHLSGQSLLPDLRRAPGSPDPERPVLVDMARGPYNAEREAFIEHDLKLTLSDGRVLGLYDLARDPGEKSDLSADRARVSAARDEWAAFATGLKRVPMPQP